MRYESGSGDITSNYMYYDMDDKCYTYEYEENDSKGRLGVFHITNCEGGKWDWTRMGNGKKMDSKTIKELTLGMFTLDEIIEKAKEPQKKLLI